MLQNISQIHKFNKIMLNLILNVKIGVHLIIFLFFITSQIHHIL